MDSKARRGASARKKRAARRGGKTFIGKLLADGDGVQYTRRPSDFERGQRLDMASPRVLY